MRAEIMIPTAPPRTPKQCSSAPALIISLLGYIASISFMSHTRPASLSLILTAVIGLSASRAVAADDNPVPRTDGPNSQDYPALHNLLAVSPRIYSGGEPDGDAAFEALRKLGVKTIVSVDGARPTRQRPAGTDCGTFISRSGMTGFRPKPQRL